LRQLVLSAPMITLPKNRRTIGEVAQAVGLTIRTLRHYENLGLLGRVGRSDGGRRVYGETEVHRLYQIRALRDLGLPLADIRFLLQCGTPEATFADVIARYRQWVTGEINRMQRLLEMLDLASGEGSTTAQAPLELFDAMSRVSRHAAARTVEAESGSTSRAAWSSVADELRACVQLGLDPTTPRPLEAARRASALIEEFAGGDAAIKGALATIRKAGPAKFGDWDRTLFQYLERGLEVFTSKEDLI
jgi:MerR family transcriptional regulator, thiopeptide resistance regulator